MRSKDLVPQSGRLCLVWEKSWGSPLAWPLPEIYNIRGTNATQWYTVALYNKLYGWDPDEQERGARMLFPGVLTQWELVPDEPELNNRPEVGWRQLLDALNQDTRTNLPYMPWLTNIEYLPTPTPTLPCFDC